MKKHLARVNNFTDLVERSDYMLATDILRNEKRKCTFWKIATAIALAVAIAEFVLIAKGVF